MLRAHLLLDCVCVTHVVRRAFAALIKVISSSFLPASGTSSIISRSATTVAELPLLFLEVLLRREVCMRAISLNSDDLGSSWVRSRMHSTVSLNAQQTLKVSRAAVAPLILTLTSSLREWC